MSEERETVRCRHCDLNQFRTDKSQCRRCHRELGRWSVETVLPIYLRAVTEPAPVIPMRKAMQALAVHAVHYIGHTTKAAAALEIPHGRLKQLLREAGEDYGRDRRHEPRRRK